jgi:hypothetical protein
VLYWSIHKLMILYPLINRLKGRFDIHASSLPSNFQKKAIILPSPGGQPRFHRLKTEISVFL